MFADGEGVVPTARDVKDALAVDGGNDLKEGQEFQLDSNFEWLTALQTITI